MTSRAALAEAGQATLPPAALAFDAIAGVFDERFGAWASVAAQRRAVRRELERAFPPGSALLEIGGGTGEDAAWLADRGRAVLLTDASPAMVEVAARKLARRASPASAEVVAAEALEDWAIERARRGAAPFDGAFSNFAALNCVADLRPVARGLARLLRPGAPALLVLFGTLPPGELLVELLRGRPRAALRRLSRGDVPARLGGREFTVRYHRRRDVARAFEPWFRLEAVRGIGVFVPPSAAEPWITAHPRLLGALEALDARAAGVLARFGDHVLYRLVRTAAPVAAPSALPAADAATGAARRLRDFARHYAAHRAAEGRGAGGLEELLALPYLRTGPQAAQWAVRARTFDRFVAAVLAPTARAAGRPLRVLDLGAGNGWLARRVAELGHEALALDIRDDAVDGLGAAAGYLRERPGAFGRVVASFDALPLRAGRWDLAVFNASLHYALDLAVVLREAARVVRPGGRIVVLDSPFYRRAEHGEAMVVEKRAAAAARFGERADALMSLPFVEFLTRGRLEAAYPGAWRRHRVRYPLRHELRPVVAALRRRRPPSRFDLWECIVA
ncbi:MAG: methyltransferase domain-containing protein [Gemmatimonadetes bacterium]|nr:methyltransferase domain-containing protein [Gemmatimonadota bacterium]